MKANKLYPGKAGFLPEQPIPVGGTLYAPHPIHYNEERPSITLRVQNRGDRPIQVGSHFHFFEVNRFLQFDRKAAFGCHLNIPATTAVRFEPGDEKHVEVVPFGGRQRIIGFNGLTQGYAGREESPSYYPTKARAFRRMKSHGFHDVEPRHTHSESESKNEPAKR